jgi:hypothetical protein
MPYVSPERRIELQAGEPADTPGDLNYLVTDLVDSYLCQWEMSYSAINEVIGVLECAKLELYRRIAVKYEDAKCTQHGDVYHV